MPSKTVRGATTSNARRTAPKRQKPRRQAVVHAITLSTPCPAAPVAVSPRPTAPAVVAPCPPVPQRPVAVEVLPRLKRDQLPTNRPPPPPVATK